MFSSILNKINYTMFRTYFGWREIFHVLYPKPKGKTCNTLIHSPDYLLLNSYFRTLHCFLTFSNNPLLLWGGTAISRCSHPEMNASWQRLFELMNIVNRSFLTSDGTLLGYLDLHIQVASFEVIWGTLNTILNSQIILKCKI